MPPLTTTLWRPVGPEELARIEASGWTRFPPRLAEQPIFYPVCSEHYAAEIAERWNARGGSRGYVLKFEVESGFLTPYGPHCVGAARHQEYWIPAEHLDAFNKAIVGPLEVVLRFGHAGAGGVSMTVRGSLATQERRSSHAVNAQ